MKRRAAALLLAAAVALGAAACASKQARQEQGAAAHTIKRGDVTVHVFGNGMTLLHRRNASNKIVAVTCLAQPGAISDPAGKEGRTHLMTRTLTKGTSTRSSDAIALELDAMGARLGATDGHDSVSVTLQCVLDDLPKALEVFADVIKNPVFPIEELRTEKQRIGAEIRQREDRNPSATIRRFREQLFGSHPYGRPIEGEPESVEALSHDDIKQAHQGLFRGDTMTLAVVGDVAFEEVRDRIGKLLGDVAPRTKLEPEASKTFSPRGSRLEFTRDAEQGFVALGTFACALDSPDAPAVDVATAILGQGMSSRLFTELRDNRGLAYMVGASASQLRQGGYLLTYIGTSAETIDQSCAGLWEQVTVLQQEPVTDEELARAKAYLTGDYLRDHETNAMQAHWMAYWHASGLGLGHDREYPELLKAVTTRDVMRVANKYFNNPTTVILRPMPALAATRAEGPG